MVQAQAEPNGCGLSWHTMALHSGFGLCWMMCLRDHHWQRSSCSTAGPLADAGHCQGPCEKRMGLGFVSGSQAFGSVGPEMLKVFGKGAKLKDDFTEANDDDAVEDSRREGQAGFSSACSKSQGKGTSETQGKSPGKGPQQKMIPKA